MTSDLATRLVLLLALTTGCAARPLWPPATFSAYYGKIEADTPIKLAGFDLVIVHPGESGDNLDRDKVARLRAVGKEKTLVGYISIGEESLSPGGPPRADQDTRGPSFVGKDLKQGLAGSGYPSYFLDQRKLILGKDGFPQFGPNGKVLEEKGQDGLPDENGAWGSYYVKADDPAWQAKVFAGLDRLDKLGLDGFFLDTVDTASPWGDYGWTSTGMLGLVAKIRERYPDKRIIANRGLFYLSQDDRYAKTIDAVLFESLLTSYREETKSSSISQWARWHVQALEDDVMTAQKRTGLSLLVLDYLEPSRPGTALLVQSARTLLQGTPYALSYSHPNLDIPGWTVDELLPASAPASWPSVTGIEIKEESRGAFTAEVAFDGPIPPDAVPDLRVTTRVDVAPRRAAEVPLAEIASYRASGNKALVSGAGLDKATTYRLFFRLISKSTAPQSPFAWTAFTTAPSDLPGQVTELSADSSAEGLVLSWSSKSADTKTFRVYSLDSAGGRKLLRETPSSTITLIEPAIGSATEIAVSAVDSQGREGYPSPPLVAVRRDVTPSSPPGEIAVSGDARSTTFRWTAVPDVVSYRLFVVPQGEVYRLPLVSKSPEVVINGARKGAYRVFVTTVDKAGNQSRPGPSVIWKAE